MINALLMPICGPAKRSGKSKRVFLAGNLYHECGKKTAKKSGLFDIGNFFPANSPGVINIWKWLAKTIVVGLAIYLHH